MKAADKDTPLAVKFLTAGTAACVADAVTFPLDTAKVRLQVSLCAGVCVCVCVYVQIRKTKYVFLSCQQNAGQNDNITTANQSFQNVEKFKYLRKTLPNKNCMHKEIKSSLKSGYAFTILSGIFCLPFHHLQTLRLKCSIRNCILVCSVWV